MQNNFQILEDKLDEYFYSQTTSGQEEIAEWQEENQEDNGYIDILIDERREREAELID